MVNMQILLDRNLLYHAQISDATLGVLRELGAVQGNSVQHQSHGPDDLVGQLQYESEGR